MTYDLTKFDLGDMLKCSLRLRETTSDAATLEAAANRTCRFSEADVFNQTLLASVGGTRTQ